MINNDTLRFCVEQIGLGENAGDIIITNVTDSSTVIGTVPYDVYVGTPP